MNDRRSRLDDGGYILVALLVSIAIASVWMAAALPSWRQQVMREREEELIFRGEQYARAFRLYQEKMGTAPSSIDALVSEHVLRKKWKDPITNEDFLPRVGCLQLNQGGPGGPGVGVGPPFGPAGIGPPERGQPQRPGGPRGPGGAGPGRGGPGRGGPQTPPFQVPTIPPRGGAPIGGPPGRIGRANMVLFQNPIPQPPGARGPLPGGFAQPGQGGGLCGVQSKSQEASIKIYNGQQQYDLWQFDTTTAALLYQRTVNRLSGIEGGNMPGSQLPGRINQPIRGGARPGQTPPFGPGGGFNPGRGGQPTMPSPFPRGGGRTGR